MKNEKIPVDDLLTNISHELKTPLTIIKGSVETLLNGALNYPDKSEHFLKIIAKHTDRLNILINDILGLSYVEQKVNEQSILLENYYVHTLIEDALDLHQEMIIEKNISIILCYNKKLKISVHKQLFSMAISNLINNAIKYNVKNGSIKIKIKVIDDKLIICINDSGIGIKKKYIYRIFDKFYRIDKIKNNNSNGSGLGLSIVKQVVEAHKGSIIAKSKLNKGSKFKIILQLNNKLSNK